MISLPGLVRTVIKEELRRPHPFENISDAKRRRSRHRGKANNYGIKVAVDEVQFQSIKEYRERYRIPVLTILVNERLEHIFETGSIRPFR